MEASEALTRPRTECRCRVCVTCVAGCGPIAGLSPNSFAKSGSTIAEEGRGEAVMACEFRRVVVPRWAVLVCAGAPGPDMQAIVWILPAGTVL